MLCADMTTRIVIDGVGSSPITVLYPVIFGCVLQVKFMFQGQRRVWRYKYLEEGSAAMAPLRNDGYLPHKTYFCCYNLCYCPRRRAQALEVLKP